MEKFYLSLSKYFISLATIGVFIVAISLWLKDWLPQDFLPEIEIPKISVLINCPNCNNQIIEKEIVAPLKAQFILLDGLKNISAESIYGKGIIELEFFFGQSVEKKVYAINEIIDRTQEKFPYAAQRPVVYPFQLNDIPVVLLSVQNVQGQDDQHLEEIKRAIESLNTVSFTENVGQTLKQIVIQPHYESLDLLQISSDHLYRTIQKYISNHPLEFQIQEGLQTIDLIVIDTLSLLKNIPIDWNNQSIPLHQLANLEENIYYDGGQFLTNGQPAVLFSIFKQPHQSYQKFNLEIQKRIDDLKVNLPEYNFQILRNHSKIVQQSISALQSNFIAGVILIITLVFLFYRKLTITLLAGASLLITISCLIVLFLFLRISVNLISISTLIITVGILIDNTIIVLDGLKQIQSKNNFQEIGSRIKQLLPALVTGNLTTLIIFVPLVFLPNLSGQLLKYFGWILGLGLITGLLVSLIFLPVFFNRFFHPIPQSRLANYWTNWYIYLHKIWMKKNYLTIILSIILFSYGMFCWHKLPKDLIPNLEFGEMSLFLPIANFSDKHLKWLENLMAHSECGTWFLKYTEGGAFDRQIQSQQAGWVLGLSNCTSTSLNQFPSAFQNSFEFEKIYDHPIHHLFNFKDQFFELRIRSEDISQLSLDMPIPPTPYQLDTQYVLIPSRINKTNTDQEKVEKIIESFSNRVIVPAKPIGDQVNHIQFEKRDQNLSKILVDNKFLHFIPFSFLVDRIISSTPERIYSNANGIIANLVFPIQTFHSVIKSLESKANLNYEVRGLPNLKDEQQTDFLKIGGATVFVLIFMLFLHFQSWKLTFLIMLEIPFSIMGSLTLLYLFNASINMMSLAGMIISLGIVVNDSILKLDSIQRHLNKKNTSLNQAILHAGKERFLPIVLTSLSTLLAVIPVFWNQTLGNQLQIPFALSLLGGMTVSTFTSLFLLPKWILWLKL